MSDTKAEVLGHLPAIDAISHLCDTNTQVRVLINGLGMGMIAAAALSNPNVTRVDVVEISESLIEAMSQIWDDPRLHIHQGDALTIDLPGEWDVAWHDIWPTISDLNVAEMDRLKEKYTHVPRQECWEEETCRVLDGLERL
jgi:16S rRNA A1518/A1519 N6-dimethyltransferase RsmA/KsgA/DIM1 with predicted DNA glycosylase/AP lyase activity